MMPQYDSKRTPEENLRDARLEELLLGLDPLHNIKGFLDKILALEAKTTAKQAFLEAMYQVTRKDALSKLEGKEHRLLIVFYEDIFLPAMPDGAHKTKFASFCHLWNEVSNNQENKL